MRCRRCGSPRPVAINAAEQLSAEKLPYVVVPSSSSIWNYGSAGIKGGGVVAVIYKDKVEYAVVGDTGPSSRTWRRSDFQ